jgi:hypothetical protein
MVTICEWFRNVVTVFERGKEKIMESENQAVSKWEELVALVDEGVTNMTLMRDILEAFKGKMEIYAQKCGMGCVDEGKGPMEVKQGKLAKPNLKKKESCGSFLFSRVDLWTYYIHLP